MTTSVQVQAPSSPDGSVDSYDFGEDPDATTLLIIDLRQSKGELKDQVNTLQQKTGNLEPQVSVAKVLHHMAAPLGLIFNYTPTGNRFQELLNLGLDEDVCDGLAEAMALDNGMGFPNSGILDNE